ncbi:DUF2083 domain-containing protein [Corynebacterium incognita]|uniref:DUF2083 domain-containing protein n=1 Tax=Corynebacterium incognita TaxID=2754725 RepID=A0A7G7CN69_9CORY|nr:short-chain fatty acyl-CoA regulator family protein [Corynebacterium incognita]QNE89035.1 DUF2083 domain-containing protein [Corynebacterium incognita]
MRKHYAGAKIHALRRAHRLTQVEMAKKLGLSVSYLNQIENDQRPLTVTVLLTLANNFDTDPSYFSDAPDARLLSELRATLPALDDAALMDLADRFPDAASDLAALSHRVEAAPPPQDHQLVRDFFYDGRAYIDQLDTRAEAFAASLGDQLTRLTRLSAIFDRDFGINVRSSRHREGPRSHFDPATRDLSLRSGLAESQLVFDLAMNYCTRAYSELLEELSAPLPTPGAQAMARKDLAKYFAAAVVMPYEPFLETVENLRYDMDAVAIEFGTGFEAAAHRLTSLQRPQARAVPFFFARTDRAGNISKRQAGAGFHFSRDVGTCPLWVVHRAFETPNRITRQVATMPDGRTHLWIARMVQGNVHPFGQPRKEFAVSIGCDIEHADAVVYADGLNLSPDAATPIGPGCALCPRTDCTQRAFPMAAALQGSTRDRRAPRGGEPPR